jgi:hypothetical protein
MDQPVSRALCDPGGGAGGWVPPGSGLLIRPYTRNISRHNARLRGSPPRGRMFYSFLPGQLRPLLRPPKKEFAVLFIVGPGRIPFALAGVF